MASTQIPPQQDQVSHEPKPKNAETDLDVAPKPPQQPTNHDQPIAILVPQTPQVYLTFLLVSGRRKTMSFDPEAAVGRVKELVWNAWPSEWQDERPPAPSYFRILHLGKILQDDDTLTKLSFPMSLPPPSTDSTTPYSHLTTDVPSSPIVPSSPVLDPTSPSHESQRVHQHPHATIVHLSIRSYAPPTDDDLKKDKSKRARWGRTNTNTGSVAERVISDGADGPTDGVGSSDRGCCGCVIC